MTIRVSAKPATFGKVSGSYTRFKDSIKEQCSDLEIPPAGEICVILRLFLLRSRVRPNRCDLDNFPKAIIDALDEAGAVDESAIASIWIERVKVDRAEDEGVEIALYRHSSVAGPAIKEID